MDTPVMWTHRFSPCRVRFLRVRRYIGLFFGGYNGTFISGLVSILLGYLGAFEKGYDGTLVSGVVSILIGYVGT